MRRPFRSTKAAPSKRVQSMLLGAQERGTIRRMLSIGGSIAIEGDRATITIPTGGFGTFPAAMVREVQEAIARGE